MYCSNWVTHFIFPAFLEIPINSELVDKEKTQSPEIHGVSVPEISNVHNLSPLEISTDTILPAWLIEINLPLSITGLAVIEFISDKDVDDPVLDSESVQTTDPFKVLIA